MPEQVIAWVGTGLGALVLIRGISNRLFSKFGFFYAFITGALVVEALLFFIYAHFPGIYRPAYWTGEFLTMVLACGIVLEIFHHVLSMYPGPEKLARLASTIAFAVILCFSGVYPLMARMGSVSGTMEDLERNLRMIQALFLTLILAVVAYYRIQISRNMKGMIAGYGFSIIATLTTMAADFYTDGRFYRSLGMLRQLGYTVPIAIWLVTLWSYSPSPTSEASSQLEQDYNQVAQRMHTALIAMRGYVDRAVRH